MSAKAKKIIHAVESTVAPVSKPAEAETIMSDAEVKVKVLINTVHWEKGTFEKGETFTCTREELAKFGKDVEVIA